MTGYSQETGGFICTLNQLWFEHKFALRGCTQLRFGVQGYDVDPDKVRSPWNLHGSFHERSSRRLEEFYIALVITSTAIRSIVDKNLDVRCRKIYQSLQLFG